MTDDNEEIARLNKDYDVRAATRHFDIDAIYRHRSDAAFEKLERVADIVYDPASGSRLDIYPAKLHDAPLFVWFHGGYWRASTKNNNAFVAPGLIAQGIGVANVDYTLAPAANLGEIVRQVRASIAWLSANGARYGMDTRNIHIGGHSAGGHLVGMLLADSWQQSFGLPRDVIASALAVSGLFDLAPLRKTFVNDALNLDEATSIANSPIHCIPRGSEVDLLLAVGGSETGEFQRQTGDYGKAWMAAGNRCETIAMPGFHHFDILLELESAGNPLFDALVKSIGR
jgi:arylformamidase